MAVSRTKLVVAGAATLVGGYFLVILAGHKTIAPPPGTRNAYYVSTSGSATATGNLGSPLTLAAALKKAGPGDLVVLSEGDYSATPFAPDSSGKPGAPVTYVGNIGDQSTGAVTLAGFKTARQWLTFKGIRFKGGHTLVRNGGMTASRLTFVSCTLPDIRFFGAQDCRLSKCTVGSVGSTAGTTIAFEGGTAYGGEWIDIPLGGGVSVAMRDTLEDCVIHLGTIGYKGIHIATCTVSPVFRRCQIDGLLKSDGETTQAIAIYNTRGAVFEDCRVDIELAPGYASASAADALWLRDSTQFATFRRDTFNLGTKSPRAPGVKFDLTRTGHFATDQTYGLTWDACVIRASAGCRIQAIGNRAPSNTITGSTLEHLAGGPVLTLQGCGAGENPQNVYRNWNVTANRFVTSGSTVIRLDKSGYCTFAPAATFAWDWNAYIASGSAPWDGRTLATMRSSYGLEAHSTLSAATGTP